MLVHALLKLSVSHQWTQLTNWSYCTVIHSFIQLIKFIKSDQ